MEERETTWFNRQQLFQPLDRFRSDETYLKVETIAVC